MQILVEDQPTGCVDAPNMRIIIARSPDFSFMTNVATFEQAGGLALQVAFNPIRYIGTLQYSKTEESIEVLRDPDNYRKWLDDTQYMFASKGEEAGKAFTSIVCADLRAIAFNAVDHQTRVVPDDSYIQYRDITRGFDQYIGDTSEGSFHQRLFARVSAIKKTNV